MKTSTNGCLEILSYEGIALSKYYDSVGVQTIGAGATVSEIPNIKQWAWDKTLTLDEVADLFKKSLTKYENGVNKAVKVAIKQHQFDALVSFCYNVGTGGMSKSTLLKRINAGARLQLVPQIGLLSQVTTGIDVDGYQDDAPLVNEFLGQEMVEENQSGFVGGTIADAFMMWTKPKEITGRRIREMKLYTTGKYSNNGKALLFPVSQTTHKPLYRQGKEIDMRQYFN